MVHSQLQIKSNWNCWERHLRETFFSCFEVLNFIWKEEELKRKTNVKSLLRFRFPVWNVEPDILLLQCTLSAAASPASTQEQ